MGRSPASQGLFVLESEWFSSRRASALASPRQLSRLRRLDAKSAQVADSSTPKVGPIRSFSLRRCSSCGSCARFLRPARTTATMSKWGYRSQCLATPKRDEQSSWLVRAAGCGWFFTARTQIRTRAGSEWKRSPGGRTPRPLSDPRRSRRPDSARRPAGREPAVIARLPFGGSRPAGPAP